MAEVSRKTSIMLLTEAEAAAIIGKTVLGIRYLRKKGRLSYISGRPILIDQEDLEKFIQEEQEFKRKKNAPYTPGTPEYEARVRKEMILRIRTIQLQRRMGLRK